MNKLSLALLCLFVGSSITGICQPIIELGFNSSVDNTGILSMSPTLKGKGSYVTDRFGYDCGALEFDGRSTYLEIPTSDELENIEEFSVSVWLYIDKQKIFTQDDLSWLTLICKGEKPDEMVAPQFRLQVTNATVSINSAYTEPASVPIPTDRWFYFVGTFDSSRIKLYIDNKIVYDEHYSFGQLQANRQPSNIGRDVPGNLEYFSGIMDDFRLFNYALSDSEVEYVAFHSVPVKEPVVLPKSESIGLFVDDDCKTRLDYSLPSLPYCMNGIWKSKGNILKGKLVTVGEYVDIWEVDEGDSRVEISYKMVVKDSIGPGVDNYKDLHLIADVSGFANLPRKAWKENDNCNVKSDQVISGPVLGNPIKVGQYLQRIQVTDESGNSSEFSRAIIVESLPQPQTDPLVLNKTLDESTTRPEFTTPQAVEEETEPAAVTQNNSKPEVDQFTCPSVKDFQCTFIEGSERWDFEARSLDVNPNINKWSASVSKGGMKGSRIEELFIDIEFSNAQKLICRLNGFDIIQHIEVSPEIEDVLISEKESAPVEDKSAQLTETKEFEIDVQKHLSANTSKITVFYIDSQLEDNDTISVYLNNTLVEKNMRLENINGGKKPIRKWRQIRNLAPSMYTLQKGENVLSIVAVNLGDKGKNTIKLVILEGAVYDSKSFSDSKFVELPFAITSDIGSAGTIIIDL